MRRASSALDAGKGAYGAPTNVVTLCAVSGAAKPPAVTVIVGPLTRLSLAEVIHGTPLAGHDEPFTKTAARAHRVTTVPAGLAHIELSMGALIAKLQHCRLKA